MAYRNSTVSHVDVAALISDLDVNQRQAVTTASSLVAVIAGAGSGKTRVLTRRIAYRIHNGSADAQHTLVLTFTREAAGELRRRLPRLGIDSPPTASTFHSICRRLLNQRWADRDERPPTVRNDRSSIVANILSTRQIAGDQAARFASEVTVACSRGWSAEQYTDAIRTGQHRSNVDARVVADVLEQYTTEKRQRHIIDLDDLLRLTVEALETDREFAVATRWRFRHLLIDEAQDLNPLQHRLIDCLRSGVDDLFLVGDPAQSIFGFNGSDPALLTQVEARFSGVEVIRLPTNYRSTPEVVAAGRHVLAGSGQRADIAAALESGPVVRFIEFDDELSEASGVAEVASAADPHLIRHGQVAILARTHAVADQMRTALEAAGLPVKRLTLGPGSPYGPHLQQLYRCSDNDQIRAWSQDHHELLEGTDDEALAAVVRAAFDFMRHNPTGSGTDFEAWVDSTNPFGQQVNGVEISTFHAAKGREWDTVLVVGCETGLVPHRSARTKELQLEEARLLYVAVTRAQRELIVTSAARRGGYQRKLTPLLDGWNNEVEPIIASPLGRLRLPPREDSLRRLQKWRAKAAKQAGVLPTQLLTDQALSTIADELPTSAAELNAVTGLGPITANHLYPGIDAALHFAEVDVD